MDDKQSNQVGRAQKDATFLTSHAADLTATPEIGTTLLPLLKTQIETALDNDALATQDNTGHTEDKSDDRTNLEDAVFHVATGLVSYADDAEDFVLQNMIEFPVSAIQGFRDIRLAQYAETVLDKVAVPAIATALAAKHNVTTAAITELQTLTTNFKNKIAIPLEKRAEAAAYGKLVDRNISAINQTLDKIRRKLNTYRKTNRLLYDMFEAVDVLDSFGQGGSASNTISGTIGAGETKQAIPITAFAATTPVKLLNKGTTTLAFIAYLNGVANGTLVTVPAGATVQTNLGALANNADAIYVQNTGTLLGSWGITL